MNPMHAGASRDRDHQKRPGTDEETADATGLDPKQVGRRLRLAREAAGMTQQQVHSTLGCTIRSLTRWEHGEHSPGFDWMVKLADLLGVSLDWVAGRTPISQLLQPGMVLVNPRALGVLQRLVEEGKAQHDLPPELVRNPGVDYLFTIPEETLLLRQDAAGTLDMQMQQMWRRLKR